VAELEDVSMSFGGQKIFDHISLLIRKGDGVAIVGPNGAGKTTLLRVLLGELESPTGRVKIGSRVKIGYFSQQHEGLDPEHTVLDEITYAYGVSEEQARKYLGAFLFHGDDVYRRIGELSGGEQSRVAFLKLMMTGANFLVLDEPTNHLDIPAKEAVEEALMAFPGTFLAVSHDRYFLDKVSNCTLELENGSLTEYNGNYSYYRMKKELAAQAAAEEKAAAAKMAGDKAKKLPATAAETVSSVRRPGPDKQVEDETAKAQKAAAELHAVQAMSDTKRAELISRTEAEIAMAEAELKGLEFAMNQPEVQQDPEQSAAIAAEYAAKEKEIEQRYAKWERLTEA
jgi:ATP-binding cassette subfamily F protein 3